MRDDSTALAVGFAVLAIVFGLFIFLQSIR